MKVDDLLSSARDAFTVKRVYGEPYEKDGLTVIPAAAVRGGAGGGTGHDEKGQEGEGGGFGMTGRPAGAYVPRSPPVDDNPPGTFRGVTASNRDKQCQPAVAGWQNRNERSEAVVNPFRSVAGAQQP